MRKFLFEFYEYRLGNFIVAYVIFMLKITGWMKRLPFYLDIMLFIFRTGTWIDLFFKWYAVAWLKYYTKKREGYDQTLTKMARNFLCPFYTFELYEKIHYPSAEVLHSTVAEVADSLRSKYAY